MAHRIRRFSIRTGVAVLCGTSLVMAGGGVAVAETFTGTNGPDTIVGTADPDTISARGGDDIARGLGGDDVIHGGTGADRLSGGDGIDRIDGGTGDDVILGGADRDGLVGNGGNDTIDGGSGDDFTLAGGPGDDTVFGRDGDDHLDGDEGSDTLFGGTGEDTLFGLDGNDHLDGGADADEVFGGPGADDLNGGAGNDELEGEEGADRIEGGAGNDELEFFTNTIEPDSDVAKRDVVLDFEGAGQAGGDTLVLSGEGYAWVGRIGGTFRVGTALPGAGNGVSELGYLSDGGRTFLIADSDDDGLVGPDDFAVEFTGDLALTPGDFTSTDFVIAGTNGDDVIVGTAHDDRIFAAGGNDTVTGRGGNDEIHGGQGNDTLDGGPGGFDNLFGEDGTDTLTLARSDGGGVASGGEGADVLYGSNTSFSNFDNSLQGDDGDDDLHAGSVGTTANGGGGSDRLFSGPADDQLEAGRDASGFDLDNAPDLFVYDTTGRGSKEGSTFGDVISGFQDGSDLFDLRGSGLQFTDLTITNGDFQTTIMSSRGMITIFESSGQGVDIDANDFLFDPA